MKGIDPAPFTEAATEEVSRNKQPPSHDSQGHASRKKCQRNALGLVTKILKNLRPPL